MAELNFRPCYWALRVGDRQEMLNFLTKTLGMSILRHSEYTHGLDEEYTGPWSRTIVGYSSENLGFSLSIIFIYEHPEEYVKGNDLVHIEITAPVSLLNEVRKSEYVTLDLPNGEDVRVKSASGYDFVLKKGEPGDDTKRISAVRVNAVRAWETITLYDKVFGMKEFESHNVRARAVYSGEQEFVMEFAESIQEIEHSENKNRFTITTNNLEKVKDKFEKLCSELGLKPLIEKTFEPGSGTAKALIIYDIDDNEVCVVDEMEVKELPSDEIPVKY